MKRNCPYFIIAMAVILLAAMGSCSTQKNTARNRWWHAFNARYNTYYNGTVAYIDASLEKEQGNKDNFTEIIPLYTVANKQSRELGKNNYDRAIEKCEKAIQRHSIKRRPDWNKKRRKTERDIEWLSRREYNPFIWKAWLLMGRSQFFKGSFEDAASTFAYMSRLYATQPAIYGKARAWLAKCYIEQDWLYDAEDVIRNMERDSIHWRAQKEWDYTYADYYIHEGDYAKAIPYLRKCIKHEMRRKQRAREWYLMGQLQAAVGNKTEAYKAFKKVVKSNPPYELEFNARISMSEVMAHTNAKQMVSKLKRMAASDKNKEYLDQVYYAIGNIYLAQHDTLQAISAYERGNAKATRSGIEKGVLLLHLGDLYWQKEKYSDARRCYGEAIGLLDKDRKDYEQLSQRSKVLDELVPFTDAVHLQDSLQALAKMNENDRNAAIDRVIAELKKKEKEERNKQAEADAEKQLAQNSGMGNLNNNKTQNNQFATNNSNGLNSSLWYFYNPIAVSQGKTTFQRQWGKRENVDNWQRINKTVVSNAQGAEEMSDQMRDSLAQVAAKEDSIKQITDSAQNNPHKREYYLAQIPFTPEQVEASNKILEDGLYHSGVIFKDKLDNLGLSEKALRRLETNYKDYEHMDDVYYHLYLLYSRKNESQKAATYTNRLKEEYPNSQWTTLLSDPYYVQNAKFGIHIEDSLYTATYEAFKASRYSEAKANARISADRFPLGANRDKFLFIGGMSKLNDGDAKGCVEDMKTVVEKYPNSRISEMAGMIVNGVNAGRRLHGGKFDIGDVWNRRSIVLTEGDSAQQKGFTNERNTDFVFMLVYHPDSINENQLLFEMAKFNFTTYLVRNFDINIENQDGLHRMMLTGFRNYDEASQYAHAALLQTSIARLLNKSCRAIIISASNLELLGTRYTYNDYAQYYSKHFAPLKVSTYHLLTEPTEIIKAKEPQPSEEDIDNELEEYERIDNSLFIPNAEAPQQDKEQGTELLIPQTGKTETPDEKLEIPSNILEKSSIQTEKPNTIEEKAPSIEVSTGKQTTGTTQTKQANATNKPVEQPQRTEQPKKAEPKKAEPKKTDTGFYFEDGFGEDNKNNAPNKKQSNNVQKKKDDAFDLEDEYYDLEGF